MTNIRIKMEGIDKLVAALRNGVQDAPRALAHGLDAERADIMHASMAIVPLDTGTLHGSAKDVSRIPPRITRNKITVTMGYNTDYAVFVHEAPQSLHWSRPGSGPKFLERPVLAAAAGFGGRVAQRIKAGIERGFLR